MCWSIFYLLTKREEKRKEKKKIKDLPNFLLVMVIGNFVSA